MLHYLQGNVYLLCKFIDNRNKEIVNLQYKLAIIGYEKIKSI